MAGRSRPETFPLRLVFVASEFAPLAQTGGLGEAVASLARALSDRGHEVECILPAYASTLAHPALPALQETGRVEIDGLDGPLIGRWRTGQVGPCRLHLLELGDLFQRPTLYGGEDEGLRFATFSRAAAARCVELAPDVLVAHDWQAALTICVLRTLHDRGPARGIGAVQVVHNNAHQGCFDRDLLPVTGLPGEFFAPDGLEFHGELSLLKGGLAWADRIVAVSPSYAEELQTPAFGEGLEGLYRFRSHRVVGICNGIDVQSYDPAKDAALASQFDGRSPANRGLCREALLAELGLEEPKQGWLLAAVGRLAAQKGWDVLADATPELVAAGASLVLLGDGDPAIATRLHELVRRWPTRVSLQEGWNDRLARRIYAGADTVVVPSRFEPCGLVQLVAQRYGALPVAHAVGGLRDTIEDGATGILFSPLSVEALVQAVKRGAALRCKSESSLHRALSRADVSWKTPAAHWERQLARVANEAAGRL